MNRLSCLSKPGVREICVDLPESKSLANRLMVMRFLKDGIAEDVAPGSPDDMIIMSRLLRKVAAHQRREGYLTLDCGAAGTVSRFLTAVLSVTDGQFILKGSERMQQRPMKPLVDALRQLGAKIESETPDDLLPLVITGRELDGGHVDVDANISSQFISALILIAPAMKRGLFVRMKGKLVSEPYVHMTVMLMREAGIRVMSDEQTINISPGLYQDLLNKGYADWSAAAPWYELVALDPELKVHFKNLNSDGLQGDEKVRDLFRCFGVVTISSGTGVTIFNAGENEKIPSIVDFTECPDLAPCYLATLAGLNIRQRINGLKTLRLKETDRLVAIQEGIRGLGGLVEILNDDTVLTGHHQGLHHGKVSFCDDHRIAFAFAPLAVYTGHLLIDDPLVVVKSYPDFFKHLSEAGIVLE